MSHAAKATFLSSPDLLLLKSQCWHLNGNSPECLSLWSLSLFLSAYDKLHSSHLYGFEFVWQRLCLARLDNV